MQIWECVGERVNLYIYIKRERRKGEKCVMKEMGKGYNKIKDYVIKVNWKKEQRSNRGSVHLTSTISDSVLCHPYLMVLTQLSLHPRLNNKHIICFCIIRKKNISYVFFSRRGWKNRVFNFINWGCFPARLDVGWALQHSNNWMAI